MKENYTRGFTLVESLISIFILVLAVTGATSVIQSALSTYIFSKDQVTAFYLAQEGIEEIRNLRDENNIAEIPWLTGISADPNTDPCYFGNPCLVDTTGGNSGVAPPLSRCSGSAGVWTCDNVRQSAVSGVYGQDTSWPETIFNRQVLLSQVSGNPDEISVLVTVTWNKGLITREFKAHENIFNLR